MTLIPTEEQKKLGGQIMKLLEEKQALKDMLNSRIKQLESQIGCPEVVNQNRIEIKLDTYREILTLI